MKQIKVYPFEGAPFIAVVPNEICKAEELTTIENWVQHTFSWMDHWEFVPDESEEKQSAPDNYFRHTGIIRRIDDLGRIVIPREIRHSLSLQENDPMEYMIYGQCVVIRKYFPDNKIAAHLEMLKNVVTEENLERKDLILRMIDNISEIL